MNFDSLTDVLIAEGERILTSQAAATVQTRVSHAVQRAVDFVDGFRSWHYKYRTVDINVPLGDQPLLPTSPAFKSFGIAGGVFLHEPADKRTPLTYAPMWLYYRLRARKLRRRPTHYSLGEGVSGNDTRYLFLEPLSTKEEDIEVVFERAVPRFTYGDSSPLEIPEHWHQPVLYEWALLYLMRDNANAQAVREQRQIAQDALNMMAKEERHGREAIHNIAPYGAGIVFSGPGGI